MQKEIAQHIMNAAGIIGGIEISHEEDYSGRGMYGSTTHAIICTEAEFRKICCYAAGTIDDQKASGDDPEDTFDLDDFCDEMETLRTDSMGRYKQVWY